MHVKHPESRMWQSKGTSRAGSGVPPWTHLEHAMRYRFAAGLIEEGAVVLDCACGDGAGVAEYLRARPSRLLGFDLDPEAVSRALSTVTDPAASFAVADAASLPVESGSVDLYISLETIEHVDVAEAVVGEAARLLRRSGRLICSTPNRDVTNPGTTQADPPVCRFHVREFTPLEFLHLLDRHFRRVTAYGQNRVGPARRASLELARRLPPRPAALAGRVMKLPRFLFDPAERHAVTPVERGAMYDFTVAVCAEPIRDR